MPGIDRGIDHTAITAVAAIIKINPLWLVVLLIIIILTINGTVKVTDMFLWITVLLATANTATSVEFLLNFERRMLFIVWVYGPINQQQ